MRTCPVHGDTLRYTETHLMECEVYGCPHREYNPIPSDIKSTAKMPFWMEN